MTEPQKIESFRDNFFKSVLLSLDTNRVLTDKSKLFIHESNTIGSKKKLSGLIQPISVPEIQTIIKLANQYQIGIYPISLGKNWGYGSKLPPTEDSVVLDLSKMSKIIDYNPELAYVIIEPGVSQLQLYDFLKSQDDNHVMDPSGAGPSASVVGNILERGFGIGRYCDRFTSVAGMEVILPNGEVLKTGFWGFENSKLTGTHRWGVGPYLDGIFTQSSFGIVSKICLWLNPKPENVTGFYFTVNQPEKMTELVNSLRTLLLKGVFPGALNIVDQGRVLSVRSQYPWEEFPKGSRLPFSHSLYSKFSINKFNGFAPLFGTKKQVKTQISEIKHILKNKVDVLNFVSEKKLNFLEMSGKLLSFTGNTKLSKVAKGIRGTLEVFSGNPAAVSLPSSYWRNKNQCPPIENIDPARDNCGHLWFAPTLPISGEHFNKFYSLVDNVIKFYDFETALAFTSVTPRAFSCTVPIFYDRSSNEEVKRAHECYETLFNECIANGYPPYRVSINSMEKITKQNKPYWELVKTIKDSIDPQNIISPGRYCPSN